MVIIWTSFCIQRKKRFFTQIFVSETDLTHGCLGRGCCFTDAVSPYCNYLNSFVNQTVQCYALVSLATSDLEYHCSSWMGRLSIKG